MEGIGLDLVKCSTGNFSDREKATKLSEQSMSDLYANKAFLEYMSRINCSV
jgi:hypothetical protein